MRRRAALVGVAVSLLGVGPAFARSVHGQALAFTNPVVAIPAPAAGTAAGAQAEPFLLLTKSGTMYVSAMGQQRDCRTGGAVTVTPDQTSQNPDCVWRSDDDGLHWRLAGGGASTGSDVQLALTRGGTLIEAADAKQVNSSGIGGITVLRTRDQHTWAQSSMAGDVPFADRSWLLTMPNGDVLLAYASPTTGHVFFTRSPDDGATWAPAIPVTAAPSQMVQVLPGALTYDAARKQLVLPLAGTAAGDGQAAYQGTSVSGNEQEQVARSSDGGVTWQVEPVAVMSKTLALQNVAVDAKGREYYQNASFRGPIDQSSISTLQNRFSRPTDVLVSRDVSGSRWSPPVRLNQKGHDGLRSWIVAAGDGRVAVTWMDSATPQPGKPREWTVKLASSIDAGQHWRITDVSRGPIYQGPYDGAFLDSLHLGIDHTGRLCASYPRQLDPAGEPARTEVIVSCQTSGPRFR